MSQNWIEVLLNWLPMLLLIGVWLFVFLRMRSGPFTKYQKDCLDLTRRQVEALEHIAALLEKRAT